MRAPEATDGDLCAVFEEQVASHEATFRAEWREARKAYPEATDLAPEAIFGLVQSVRKAGKETSLIEAARVMTLRIRSRQPPPAPSPTPGMLCAHVSARSSYPSRPPAVMVSLSRATTVAFLVERAGAWFKVVAESGGVPTIIASTHSEREARQWHRSAAEAFAGGDARWPALPVQVTDLPIPQHAARILVERERIATVAALAAKTAKDIRAMRGVGLMSLKLIREALAEHGMSLKGDAHA